MIQQALHRQPNTAAQYLQQMYAAQQQHLMLQTAALQQQHLTSAQLQSLAAVQQVRGTPGAPMGAAVPRASDIHLLSSPGQPGGQQAERFFGRLRRAARPGAAAHGESPGARPAGTRAPALARHPGFLLPSRSRSTWRRPRRRRSC